MKKNGYRGRLYVFLQILFLMFLFTPLYGKSQTLEFTLGTWYLHWEQDDSPNNQDIENDIYHRFTIKNSFAKEVAVSGSWHRVKGGIKYIFTKKDEELTTALSTEQKLSKILGFIGIEWEGMASRASYIHSKTEGYSTSIDPDTLNEGFVKFSTELNIGDITFYPFFNKEGLALGAGYRFMDYTLPQTLYVIGSNKELYRFVEPNMNWKAHFLTLTVEKVENQKGFLNFFGKVIGGYVLKLEPKSENVEKANESEYLQGGKGYFYEIEFGILFSKKSKVDNKLLKSVFPKIFTCKIGYRYSDFVLETAKEDDIYIYARAESKFSGPFVSLALLF
ncbi:MAG: hypothetical protein ABGX27_05145 [Desulfurobacteriaceae bacterium]